MVLFFFYLKHTIIRKLEVFMHTRSATWIINVVISLVTQTSSGSSPNFLCCNFDTSICRYILYIDCLEILLFTVMRTHYCIAISVNLDLISMIIEINGGRRYLIGEYLILEYKGGGLGTSLMMILIDHVDQIVHIIPKVFNRSSC